MKAKRVITGIILLTVMALFLGFSAPVYGIPAIPHVFYGTLTIDGQPAPIGTVVEAKGVGVQSPEQGNPLITNEAGFYGSSDPMGSKLVVQGNITEGAVITFYINGESTGQTYPWKSGEETRLDLEIGTGGGGSTGGGGGGGGEEGEGEGATPPTPPSGDIVADLFGSQETYSISDTGEILDTITATSPDGRVTITIPAGTIALDKNRNPITSLTIEGNLNPLCPLVEGAHIIGLAYDCQPDGTTFDPPITLVFNYDDNDVPEGIAEEDLVLAYCDEVSLKWIEVDSEVNTEDNTITAQIYHFTTFAILYYEVAEVPSAPKPPAPTKMPAAFTISSLTISPVEVNVGEEVTISLTVTNTGGESGTYQLVLKINGEVEDTQEVSIAAGESREVKLTTSKNAAGTYTVDCNGLVGTFVVKEAGAPPVTETPTTTAEPQFNWPVLGGFIAAVIVVISLVIFFVTRRRSSY